MNVVSGRNDYFSNTEPPTAAGIKHGDTYAYEYDVDSSYADPPHDFNDDFPKDNFPHYGDETEGPSKSYT